MDSFEEGGSLVDIMNYLNEDTTSNPFLWDFSNTPSSCLENYVSPIDVVSPIDAVSHSQDKGECTRKRGRSESCSGPGATKACREKLRRDKMNDRFSDLSAILDPGRPVKTDKSAILSDAIHVLNQLRAEAQELKDTNEKLQEDIKNLKVEKNELREEKLLLKADKERMEQQVRAMTVVPTGFLPPPHPASYQPGINKMMAFPGYGGIPMWHWIPQAARDTSQDHELRPPVA